MGDFKSTDYLETRETLRDSHRMLFTLLSNLPGMAYRCRNDRDWTMEFVSEGCYELTGYLPVDLIQNNKISYAQLIHPDDRQPVWDEVQAALRENRPFKLLYRVITARREKKWVWEQGRGVFSSEGDLLALEGFITDITERKQAEQLQNAVYRIAQAADSSNSLEDIFVAVHNIIQDVMPANNFYIALYDEKENLLSFPYYIDEVETPPSPRKPAKGLTEYVLRNGKSLLCSTAAQEELRNCGKAEVRGVPPQIWLGVPLCVEKKTVGVMAVQHYSDPEAYTEREQRMLEFVSSQVARAIDRKQAETRLENSLSLLRATLDSTADGILVVNLEGKIVSWNQKFLEMWAIPESVIAAEDDDQARAFVLDQLTDPNAFTQRVQELYAQPEVESHDLIELKDGRFFERFSQPQRLNGKIVGRVWSFHDITQHRRLEEQLRQSQKMDAVGRLAGGIAHDFNNLLTVILGRCEILQRHLGEEDPIRPDIDLIKKTSDRAATLTRQLLAFSRRQPIEAKVLDLNSIVSEMDTMLRRLIGDHIEFYTKLSPDIGRVKTDPNQMEQVLLNLVVNARDAMPQGGKITIETAKVDLDETFAKQHMGAYPGPHVMLAVSDTGIGMDAETQSHIFEPFFTTKEKGKGTGLGLSTVYGIVKQSRGNIWVYSEPGRGTTFKIYLPRLEEFSEPGKPSIVLADSKRGSGTVLVVEDEDDVRALARLILEMHGYKVLEASNGEEALQVSQQDSGAIHLLLTDVVMPKMNGPELAKRLALLHPEMKVLYMSGYTGDTIAQLGVLDADATLLQKPFTLSTLASKVADVLEMAKQNLQKGEKSMRPE